MDKWQKYTAKLSNTHTNKHHVERQKLRGKERRSNYSTINPSSTVDANDGGISPNWVISKIIRIITEVIRVIRVVSEVIRVVRDI